jgi:sulfotransferase
LPNKQIYFISGLPRSGSTLLSSILSQNPKFYASISSPVYKFVDSMTNSYNVHGSNNIITETHVKNIIKSSFDIIYNDQPQEIIFDTNRLWTLRIELLHQINPNLKIICCVRSIIEILNSFERVYRDKVCSLESHIYNNNQYKNVYARCDDLMSWNGIIGCSLDALKQAMHSKYANSICLVEYDSLINEPNLVINDIYEFLNIEPFEHDFDNLTQIDDRGCDIAVKMPGLHTVKPKITQPDSHMFIPKDIINQYKDMEYWRNF